MTDREQRLLCGAAGGTDVQPVWTLVAFSWRGFSRQRGQCGIASRWSLPGRLWRSRSPWIALGVMASRILLRTKPIS